MYDFKGIPLRGGEDYLEIIDGGYRWNSRVGNLNHGTSKVELMITLSNYRAIIEDVDGMSILALWKCYAEEFSMKKNYNLIIYELIQENLDKNKIEDMKIREITRKNNAHDNDIFSCVLLDDGSIASGGSDILIKIWNFYNIHF